MTDTDSRNSDPAWRRRVYALLAQLFHGAPDDARLAEIEACVEEGRDAGDPVTAEALARLAAVGRCMPFVTMRQDFDDLFMVPTGKYVTPYESVYRDDPIEANSRKRSRTYGPSTQEVMSFYQAVGLQTAEGYTELPDYVGLEIACMEYLCAREAEFEAQGLDRERQNVRNLQRHFIHSHLTQWFPALDARIHGKAGTEFYRTLSEITLAWIRKEASEICPGNNPSPTPSPSATV